MKQKKRLACLACFLAAAITLVFVSPIFSTKLAKNEPPVMISQEAAESYAREMIESMKKTDFRVCNDTTVIDELVPMYDFDGNINSYLFRLKTDGVKQGYLVVDANEDTAGVELANDIGEYAVDIIAKEKLGRPINKEDGIIHPALFTFIRKEKDQTYRNFATDEPIQAPPRH